MIDRLESLKLIPVVALENAADAEPLADALCAGGLPCAEITLRTESALDSIRALSKRKDFLLGAGTVHSVKQAEVWKRSRRTVGRMVECGSSPPAGSMPAIFLITFHCHPYSLAAANG
jgi:hypothetical protein